MSGFLDRVAFSVGGDGYHWRDVVASAVARGRWDAVVRQAHEAEALVRAARAARAAGTLPTRAQVDAEATEFRYARDLVTADAARRWLDQRSLTVERWTAALRRSLVRRLHGTSAPPPADGAEPDAHAALDDAICSGMLDAEARELASRAAAARAGTADAERHGAERDVRELFPLLPTAAGRLTGTGLDEASFASALERLALVECAWLQVRARTLTPERIRAQVGVHQLDWVRLDCDSLAFPDEQAAREAALSVREDGLSLAEVAEFAHATLVERDFFLEDVAPVLRDRLLGAREGEVVGPLGTNGTTTLYVVRRKTLPSPDDPAVRARVESLVMRSLLGGELAAHVEWAT